MKLRKFGFQLSVGCLTVALSLISNHAGVWGQPKTLAQATGMLKSRALNIAQWSNGRYQLCSQPQPKDWQDGVGVCVVFSKTGHQLDGYYGYPHSDRFICLRGAITDDVLKGEGMTFTWFTTPTPNITSLEKQWDAEGRLEVDQAQILKLEPVEEGWGSWVRFRTTVLDMKGLYRYSTPRMRPASELCSW